MVKSKDLSVSVGGDSSIGSHLNEAFDKQAFPDVKENGFDEGSSPGQKEYAKECIPTVEEEFVPARPLNPFHFRIHLNTPDKLKCALMTILVVPIRILLVTFFLFLTWLGCFIGLLGYSEQDLESKPMTGWRREWREKIRTMVFWAFRTFLIKVDIKGERAAATEAPILVAGPHSSFYDFGIVIAKSPVPSAVIRDETGTVVISTVLRFIQPVFVKRSSKESRLSTLSEIKNRATSTDPWSQIVIFPEGTCSNGSVLIKFKQGAFSAGVPVQPILIRYPNKLNTLTWTWDGPSALKTLWLTTCQWSTKMVIEFLPVYRPSEAEKADPILYANNVRKLMASALGLPTCEFSYDDLKYMDTGDSRQPHHTLAIVKLLKFRAKSGLTPEQLTEDINKTTRLIEELILSQQPLQLDQQEFISFLGLPAPEFVREFFDVLSMSDENYSGTIDLRVFLSALHLLNNDGDRAFKCLSENSDESECVLTLAAFCRFCWLCMQLEPTDAAALFHSLRPPSLENLKNILTKHNTKGAIYFEPAARLAIDDDGPEGKEDSKRQKAD